MKKKIGFIDLHIDEWHANHYPDRFRTAKRASEFDIHMAWEESPAPGLRPLEQWCRDFNVLPARTLEEVVEVCDALCVLAPSNPEVHERLAELPLKSGKPVYIDKPFAPDKATAERLFNLAERNRTPMFSSSALRFCDELVQLRTSDLHGHIDFMTTWGGGSSFWEYAIHQLEMIVSVMGTGVKRVMRDDTAQGTNVLLIEYGDGRHASLTLNSCSPEGTRIFFLDRPPIQVNETHGNFRNLLDAILDMFATQTIPVDKAETIEIAHLLNTAIKAGDTPGEWLCV